MGINHVLLKLNNISVRNKLLLIYISCVLLPITLINVVLWNKINQRVQEKQMAYLHASMDRIATKIQRSIAECVGLSHNIYSDQTINDFLTKKYAKPEDYVAEYNKYFRMSIEKYLPVYEQINQICFYTDNPSILSGGLVQYMDNKQRGHQRQKIFPKSKNAIILHAYMNTDPIASFNDKNNKIQFGILRKLHSNDNDFARNKLLKIDLSIDFLLEIINSEKLNGEVYFLNPLGEIVFSTKRLYTAKQYSTFISFNPANNGKGKIVINKVFNSPSYLAGWKITGVFPKDQFMEELQNSYVFVFLLAGLFLFIATSIVFLIGKSLTSRLDILSHYMKKIEEETFEVIPLEKGDDEIGFLFKQYNQMATRIKELIHDVYKAEIQKKNLELERKQAELNALQSQINPHFLFNTLETIRMRSVIKNETETADIIRDLSNLLRRLLTWEKELTTVQEELKFIKDFLKIHKYRYGDKFDYVISVDKKALKCKIPQMSLQFLVENACIHGVEPTKQKGIVWIYISVDGAFLCSTIKDNGKGIKKEKLDEIQGSLEMSKPSKRGVGIQNVYKRFQLLYGDNFQFTIKSQEDVGTEISIKLPIDRG